MALTDVDLLAEMAVAEAEGMLLTVVVVDEIPPCDFCGEPAEFDAAVIDHPGQPWAFMCGADMAAHGPDWLGEGIGQRLRLNQH